MLQLASFGWRLLKLAHDGLERDISKSEAAAALKSYLDRSCRTKCSTAAGSELDEQALSRPSVCPPTIA